MSVAFFNPEYIAGGWRNLNKETGQRGIWVPPGYPKSTGKGTSIYNWIDYNLINGKIITELFITKYFKEDGYGSRKNQSGRIYDNDRP